MKKETILKLKEQGFTPAQIEKETGFKRANILYHYYDKNKTRPCFAKAQERRREITKKCKNYKGGKCQLCGYNKCFEALEFHHLSPLNKLENVSNLIKSHSFDKLKGEMDKCVLVCSNCHREIHAGIVSIPSLKNETTQSG